MKLRMKGAHLSRVVYTDQVRKIRYRLLTCNGPAAPLGSRRDHIKPTLNVADADTSRPRHTHNLCHNQGSKKNLPKFLLHAHYRDD